jgi:gluconolactonase
MKSLLPIFFALVLSVPALAQHGRPYTRPDAVVDLRTDDGARLVNGQWRFAEAQIVQLDRQARDITPKAGAADFEDSAWESISPASLEKRRGPGGLSFAWYRINVTIPSKVGSFDPTGSTVFFEIVVDDYAEVYVNGNLPRVLGSSGQGMVKGFNAPNRIVLTRDARPGEKFQLAVFAMNGPISDPPGNFIWVRSATLDFYTPERARVGHDSPTEIVRLDPAIDSIIPRHAKIEQLADGFGFTEGPVWVPGDSAQDGYLLFSDPNNNTIYRWSSDGEINVFRSHSGYTGPNISDYGQPGSNGLALDPQGRLTICEHGNRRVTRLEKNGDITVLADRYEGKRLNSPNDLVYRSDGALFFTDPYFGLPKWLEDPNKQLPFSGVFSLKDGTLRLVSTDLLGPNGIAFTPNEKQVYVCNWDVKRKVVMRYDVSADGEFSNGAVFFDMTSAPGEEALDGVKVDRGGNLFVSGPGGVWVLSADGKHLGTIKGPQLAANMAWGGPDGRTLYLTARTALYRLSLSDGR